MLAPPPAPVAPAPPPFHSHNPVAPRCRSQGSLPDAEAGSSHLELRTLTSPLLGFPNETPSLLARAPVPRVGMPSQVPASFGPLIRQSALYYTRWGEKRTRSVGMYTNDSGSPSGLRAGGGRRASEGEAGEP